MPLSPAYAFLLLALAACPFQTLRPLFSIHGIPLHLPALLAAAAALASPFPGPASLRRTARPFLPFFFFLAVAVLSAARSEATGGLWKTTAEYALGIAFGVAAARAADTPARRTGVFRLLAALALIESAAGLWEVFGGTAARGALAVFKAAPARVGGDLRAGGTFLYATVYAMFLGATVPFAAAAAGAAGAALAGAAVFFSSSRAGWGVFAVLSLLFLAGRRRGRTSLLAGVGFAAAALFFPSRLWPRLAGTERELFVSEPVRYEALHDLSSLRRGERGVLRLRLTNDSPEAWPAGTSLVHAWARPDDRDPWADPSRIPLKAPVPPGASAEAEGPIEVPRAPGTYLLRFDLEAPDGGRWSRKGAFQPTHRVTVPAEGPWSWADAPPTEGPPAGGTPRRSSRPVLWTAAWRMFRAHPVIGAGPGAYDEMCGRFSDAPVTVRRMHAHSLYLGLLAETGAAGAALWLAGAGGILAGLFRRARAGDEGALLVALSLSAWALHGLFDDFLWHGPMGLLFYGTLGVGAALLSEEGAR